MNWQQHKAKWKDCERCSLCERRSKVVLARGLLPCDVLFIGEAPGEGEDTLGKPFVGPAGILLDRIVREAVENVNHLFTPRIAFSNLVACIPKDETNTKVAEPPDDAIKACSERLRELVIIAKPRLIVNVGKLSAAYIHGQALFHDVYEDRKKIEYGYCSWLGPDVFMSFREIVHPAAILRSNIANRGLAIQKCVVQLTQAFEDSQTLKQRSTGSKVEDDIPF